MKKVIRKILILICIGVLIFAGYNVGDILLKYKKIDDVYEEIVDDYVVDDGDAKDSSEGGKLSIDFTSLLKRNKNIVGWIEIPDTKVNYPVVQSSDNEDYLHKDIDGNYLYSGTIFVDCNCTDAFHCDNTVLYGHNMKNGSMFRTLHQYIKEDLIETEPYIYIYLPEGTVNKYQIISAHTIKGEGVAYSSTITDYDAFYDKLEENNKVNVKYKKDKNNKYITLSTCTSSGSSHPERVVVQGLLIDEN